MELEWEFNANECESGSPNSGSLKKDHSNFSNREKNNRPDQLFKILHDLKLETWNGLQKPNIFGLSFQPIKKIDKKMEQAFICEYLTTLEFRPFDKKLFEYNIYSPELICQILEKKEDIVVQKCMTWIQEILLEYFWAIKQIVGTIDPPEEIKKHEERVV